MKNIGIFAEFLMILLHINGGFFEAAIMAAPRSLERHSPGRD
jgi:hypothetical protein